MAVLATILGCFLAISIAVNVSMYLKILDVRRRTEIQVSNANKTNQMLIALLNKEPGTRPEALIEAVGTTVNKILAGQPMQVNENVQETKEEEQPYYPDVEFDEWLGTEGMPTAAGWWSPPKNVEQPDSDN